MKQQILKYLSNDNYQPLKQKTLFKKLGYGKKRLEEFEAAIQELIETKKIRKNANGKIKPKAVQKPGSLIGTMRRIASGAGFVILSEPKPAHLKEDIFVDFHDVKDAQSGDEVLVELTSKRGRKGDRSGRVVEVLERAATNFVGTYFEENATGYVQIDGSQFAEAIWVGDPGAKGAQDDDKVVIEMIRFPSPFHVGEAVLTKVLGPRGASGIDTLTVINQFGLPDDFPVEVLSEASHQTSKFDETNLEGRLDLTKDNVLTIDPKTARDFDDAISLTRTDNGHWHLGVHIADVAHFVRPGSKLDQEALKRGTSVYLPTKVLPMLPEVISNGLASLQEGKVRFVKTVFIEFDPSGIPVDTRMARSAIKVKQRFAYEEVMSFLIEKGVAENPDHKKVPVKPASEKVSELILRMHELAMILRKRRFEKGSIELNMPEVRLKFDKEGKVNGAFEADHDVSHQMIEEFMLAANVAIAQEFKDRGIPFLRRVHDDPKVEKMTAFADFVKAMGYKLEQAQSRPAIQALLESLKGKPEEHAINFAFLRSLKQAEYSPMEFGHYALAVEHYCHFTSPIRRYPDLTIHRIFDDIIDGKKKPSRTNEEDLIRLGHHCSTTSRRAERAERELTKLKLLQYMSNHIGKDFTAVITGVERFGIFAQCEEIPAEGMIHISALAETDQFQYDRDSWTLQGRKSGRTLRLGDRITVRIAHVDLDRRELDFTLIKFAPQSKTALPAKKKQSPNRRKPTQSKKKSTATKQTKPKQSPGKKATKKKTASRKTTPKTTAKKRSPKKRGR